MANKPDPALSDYDSPVPTDLRGRPLQIGDLVCYTVYSKDAGLMCGRVTKIFRSFEGVRQITTGPLINHYIYKVRFDMVDVHGNTLYEQEYKRDPVTQQVSVSTGAPRKSGAVEAAANKFLIL